MVLRQGEGAARGPGSSELVVLPDGHTVRLRRLLPEDAALYPEFMAHVSARDRRLRFFSPAEPSERQIKALTGYDPARAVAVAATSLSDGGIHGVARLHRIEDGIGEFAVLVRTDLKGHGLGRALMDRILDDARPLGISTVTGLILRENTGMLALARDLGFELSTDPDDATLVQASLDMRDVPARSAA